MMVFFNEDAWTDNLKLHLIMVLGVILLFVKIEPTDAPLITRSESTQSTYERCHWSIGGPEKRNCPFYSSDPWSHWGCLAYVMNCSHGDNYHCAKDLEGNWKEACDQFKLCQEGEEPHIVNDRVFCGWCIDSETYNANGNKPSNEFSQCPQRKTMCNADVNGRVECDEPYPDSKYKMDRQCRCAYEKNYIPRFYDYEKDTWRCIIASELICDERPCKPKDGVDQRRGEDYKCHPVIDVTVPSQTTRTSLGNISDEITNKAKGSTSTPTPVKPIETSTLQTTKKTTEKQAPDSGKIAVIAVIIILAVIAVIIILAVIAVGLSIYRGNRIERSQQRNLQEVQPMLDVQESQSDSQSQAHSQNSPASKSYPPEPTTSQEVEGIYQRVLHKNIIPLKRYLSPCTLDWIKEKEIGSKDQHMEIEDATSRRQKNQKIVDLIESGGLDAYRTFKIILWKTNQIPLLEGLKTTEQELLGKADESTENEENNSLDDEEDAELSEDRETGSAGSQHNHEQYDSHSSNSKETTV